MSGVVWNAILDNWPATLYIPTILVILVILGVITRMWDGKESERTDTSVEPGPAESPSEPDLDDAKIPVGVGAATNAGADVEPEERLAA